MPKTYSDLSDYLYNEDPELSEVFRDLSMESILQSRGKVGVTLLRPVNKQFRAQLINGALGDPDERKQTIMLVGALVIPLNLKSAEDFNLNKTVLQNGIRQVVELSNVKGGVITFANGSTAVRNPTFNDSSKERNINVYDITGNGLPIDSPAAKRIERSIKGPRRATAKGGYEIEQSRASKDLRFKISVQIENIYSNDKINGSRSNAFIETAYSLVYFILTRCGDDVKNTVFLGRILPMISYQEIDFYFFVEPHATHQEDDYLIPTSIIAEWWREHTDTGVVGFSVKNIRTIIDGIISKQKSDSVAIYGGERTRRQLLHEIQSMRESVIDEGARYAVNSVIAQYKVFAETNSIGRINNVLPLSLANRYRQNPAKKMVEDELRYVTYKIFRRFNTGEFIRETYKEILGMIGNYMHSTPSESLLKLLNPKKIEFSVDAKAHIGETCSFVQSTNYMFISLTHAESQYINQELYGKTERPDKESENIWNTTLDLHERMGTIMDSRPTQGPSDTNEKVKDLLESYYKNDKSNLDPKMRGILDEMFGRK